MSGATPHVLVFDSGLGGLTVLRAIREALPGIRLSYLSDNAGYPYGTRTEDDLIARCERVLLRAQAELRPDLLVIACNSASTVALAHIRGHLTCPVVGVVPAIKPAAACSRSKVIGLLATPGTVARAYTHQLIHQFAAHCDVILVGSSRLVDIAERKLYGEEPDDAEIASILLPFHEHPRGDVLDTIVLACTHFPLLREELAAAFWREVEWIDSSEAIARRVASLLPHHPSHPAPAGSAWFTRRDSATPRLRDSMDAFGLAAIEYLAV